MSRCLVFVVFVELSLSQLVAAGVPREECFPIERLPVESRPLAEDLLLRMLDSEALYTLVGQIKPMSESFWSVRFPVDGSDSTKLEEARVALSALRCGDEFFADVLVFARASGNQLVGHAIVSHVPSVARVVTQHRTLFARHGVTVNSHPFEVALVIDRGITPDRWRAYGHLFGYPAPAVEFFCNAGMSEQETGEFVARRFINIPVYSRPTGRFVYAVEPSYIETQADIEMKQRCNDILQEYRTRRERYIGEGKPGVVALIRDWFDDGSGHCSSAHAMASSQQFYSAEHDRAGLPSTNSAPPVYASDPAHPLNQLFRLLFFAERVPDEVGAPLPEELRGSKASEKDFYVPGWYFKKRPGEPKDVRLFGGDIRITPIDELDDSQGEKAERLLDTITTEGFITSCVELASPSARLHLQWDLLQVWDRLSRGKTTADSLLRKLATTVVALSQPREVLEQIEPGLGGLHGQFPAGKPDNRTAPYLPDGLTTLDDPDSPWVEIDRKSSKLFDAQHSLRVSRVYLNAGSREATLDLITKSADAQGDLPPETVPTGTQTMLVMSLVGLDTDLKPVGTHLIDEVRVRYLAGPTELMAENPTSSRDGWNQWIYFRNRQSLTGATTNEGPSAPFRFIPDSNQGLFLEYGTAKHTTFAGQCVLCHRATHGGNQAPAGIRSLSRYAKPVVTGPESRFRKAEAEFEPIIKRIEECLAVQEETKPESKSTVAK